MQGSGDHANGCIHRQTHMYAHNKLARACAYRENTRPSLSEKRSLSCSASGSDRKSLPVNDLPVTSSVSVKMPMLRQMDSAVLLLSPAGGGDGWGPHAQTHTRRRDMDIQEIHRDPQTKPKAGTQTDKEKREEERGTGSERTPGVHTPVMTMTRMPAWMQFSMAALTWVNRHDKQSKSS